jgi:hypothetical protein
MNGVQAFKVNNNRNVCCPWVNLFRNVLNLNCGLFYCNAGCLFGRLFLGPRVNSCEVLVRPELALCHPT